MNERYYYQDGEQVLGPFDAHAMRSLLRQKKLTPETLVCPEGTEDWQPLVQYQELSVAPAGQGFARPQRSAVSAPSHSESTRSANSSTSSAPFEPVQPGIAMVMRLIALGVMILGGFSAFVELVTDVPALIIISTLFSTFFTAVFFFAFSSLLTWVYNIMLNTARKR